MTNEMKGAFAVLTVSDKGSCGEREDTSGPYLCEALRALGLTQAAYEIVADDRDFIRQWLLYFCDVAHVALVLTTGGTGFAPRDMTPEATLAVIERPAPGLVEAMRARSLAITPHAMLSRAAAGIRGRTLIVNLPGSRKAVAECLDVLRPALPHALELLAGAAGDCGGMRGES